jgi:hypothetical protein
MHLVFANAGRQGGFALILSLLLTSLAGLVALDAFNRSQLDARLARHVVARIQADVAATGLLEALRKDISGAGEAIGPISGVFTVCMPAGPCDENYRNVSALREQLPDEMLPAVSLRELTGETVPRLPEEFSSSLRLGIVRTLEARVEMLGVARASIVAVLVLARPQATVEGNKS